MPTLIAAPGAIPPASTGQRFVISIGELVSQPRTSFFDQRCRVTNAGVFL
jgi:hypothetical protein